MWLIYFLNLPRIRRKSFSISAEFLKTNHYDFVRDTIDNIMSISKTVLKTEKIIILTLFRIRIIYISPFDPLEPPSEP